MEGPIKITLLYNNKKIKLQLPSTYNEFLKLLEDKLYLTPELVNSAIIYYQDSDGDNNILSEDSYNQSLEDNNGIFEMSLDLKNKKDDSDDDNNNNNQVNAKLGKNEIKNIEKKIAVKFSKIFEEKLKKKDLEHQKEISIIKKNFENTMKSVIENSSIEYNNLSDYYNEKMKDYFKKYNEMIIENINKGISQSNLNQLMDQFFINNQFLNNKDKPGDDDDDDQNNGDSHDSFVFSKVIDKK
jgi:hypothetical protein